MADKGAAPKAEAKKADAPKAEVKAAPAAAAPAAAAATGDEKEVCRAWRNNGECRFGEKCKYEHSEGEPIAPPPRDYTPRGECHNYRDTKTCRFAERCRFQHGEEDKRSTYRPERKEKDSAAAAAEASGEKQICRNYQKKGKCRFGDKCHHLHVAGEPKKEQPKKAPKAETKKPAAPAKKGGGAERKDAGEEKKSKRRRPRKSRADPAAKITLTEENKYDGEGIELCRNFRNKGKCRFGDDCTFSHAPGGPIGQPAGERPARAPRVPGLCYNFRDDGECEFGAECRFKHGDGDARDFSRPARGGARKAAGTVGVCYQYQESGECEYGADCRFSHDTATA